MALDIGTLQGTVSLEDQFSSAMNVVASNAEAALDKVTAKLGPLGTVAVAVTAAVTATVGAIVVLGRQGSEVNDVAATLDRFAGSAENADEIVRRMQEGTAGTVTKMELMRSSARLLAADVKLNAEEFGVMSQAAFALQNEGLGPTTQMMDTLSQAMITGRTRSVEALVGVIDLKKAEETLATTLGTTREKLDENQKAAAARMAIMDTMRDKVAKTGQQERDFGEQLDFAVTKIKDWVNELASKVAASDRINAALTRVGDAIVRAFGGDKQEMLNKIVRGFELFAEGVAWVAERLAEFARNTVEEWNQIIGIIDRVRIAWNQLRGIMPESTIGKPLASATEELKRFQEQAAKGPAGGLTFGGKPVVVVGGAGASLSERMGATASAAGGLSDEAKKIQDEINAADIRVAETRRQLELMTPALEANIVAMTKAGYTTREVSLILKQQEETVKTVLATYEQAEQASVEWADKQVAAAVAQEESNLFFAKGSELLERTLNIQRRGFIEAGQASGIVSTTIIPRMKEFGRAGEVAGKEVKSMRQHFQDGFSNAATILDNIKGKFAEVGAMAARTGEAMLKSFGSGDWIGGIVAGVTGAIGIITKLFGGISEEVKKAREELDDFRTDLHDTLDETIRNARGMETWEKDIIAVRNVFLATGRTAEEALEVTEALWDTDNPERMEAAIDEVNGAIREHEQALKDAEQDARDLEDAMEEYNITVDQMGPAFRRQKLAEQGMDLANKWRLLVGAGADVSLVADKMGENFSKFVQMAIKTGTEVPKAMQPVLQTMIDNGELLDENGEAYQTLSETGLTFSETMAEGFDRVVAALDRVIRKLAGLPDEVVVKGRVEWEGEEGPDTGEQLPGAYAPGGSDTHARMARGGFGTVSKPTYFLAGEAGAEDFMFRPVSQRPRDGAGGTLVVPVKIGEREIARAVVPLIPSELRRMGVI